MVVRIRFARGPRVSRKRGKNQRVAVAVAALLTPAAVMALALGLWRIAADLSWTSTFYIASGPLSHWQVWLAAAAFLQLCSHRLNRYGKTKETAAQPTLVAPR
ncbi:MAG TPA: hypothetical protein VG456_14290 [Candidatus Sulfopaludibacter sp.]|nr:hypothetical protein [Candidatus Sulfopaludibacter sp.]